MAMAEHDLHTIGTATFEEVSMIPRNILLRNQAVTLGDIRCTSKIKSNLFLECTTAGTTGSTLPSFANVGEGDTVTDGTVVWSVKRLGGAANFYGVCDTAAATAAKTVSITGFKLEAGASVKIKFTHTNTASSPTLNVSGTGAKSIYSNGSAIAAGMLSGGTVIEFVYDGTNYNMMGGGGTAYNIPTQSGLGNIWIE
jgi:hypothetical protein